MKRSQFNLSHEHKLSCEMGTLVPVCCEEVLAGDTFIGSSSALVRIAPLANPIMHRVELRLHHWYMPNRLLWVGWEDFITGKNDDDDVPMITTTGDQPLLDHMGVPPTTGQEVTALPVRAYNLIYNAFYRDQDLQSERLTQNTSLARICWQKDYLTVARPEPQQGASENITGQVKPLLRTGASLSQVYPSNTTTGMYDADTGTWSGFADDDDARFLMLGGANSPGPGIEVDINDLRRSMAFQRFAEARAMYGERYIDYLRFLGVKPSDGRLDRAEYLGGAKQILNFSEVLATAEGSSSNVGDMYGHGIAAAKSRRYRKMFEEHGWVLTLMSLRPKTVYQDALPRKFCRRTNMDYWQKELEVLPWQEVKETEVFAGGDPDTVFGYVPRYEEYRHGMSYVSGTFRGGTEEDWTMARSFSTAPSLNGSFVECTPTDRIYQDTNMPEALVSVVNNIQARRLVRSTAQIGGL